MPHVAKINSKPEFDELIHSGKVVLVDFTAVWCGPCRMMSPLFDRLAGQNPKENLKYVSVDIDDLPDIAEVYRIRAVPTFHAFKDGAIVGSVIGANPSGLVNLIGKQ